MRSVRLSAQTKIVKAGNRIKTLDDIIANQLRIVHEIASLLGETAAETKVAVHDLKEAIMLDEDGDDDA